MKAKSGNDRRSFLQTSGAAIGGLLGNATSAFAREEGSGSLTKGDAAILRFLDAAEILETDLWVQYNELGGVQDSEEKDGTGNALYTDALTILDGDMPQYIHDNTDDEFSHWMFIDSYLASRGAETVNLEQFRTLPGSTADGSSGKPRLTNLMQLSVDTSFWTRYRSDTNNPDLDAEFMFEQAVKGLNVGQHAAIPRSNADTAGSSIGSPTDHLKAIAFTA